MSTPAVLFDSAAVAHEASAALVAQRRAETGRRRRASQERHEAIARAEARLRDCGADPRPSPVTRVVQATPARAAATVTQLYGTAPPDDSGRQGAA